MAKRAVKRKSVDQASAIEQALGGASPDRGAKGEGSGAKQQRHFSGLEHIAWVESNCYRDVKGKGWRPLQYSGWQKTEIRKLLELDGAGQLSHRTLMYNWPRRCGKSEGAGLYVLHRCEQYDDQVAVLQGNSEDQGEDTGFKAVVDTLLNSPRLRARVASAYGRKISDGGDIEITSGVITFGKTGSVLKVQPAKEATTYGQKIHVYWNTEGCKAANDKTYQTGASSTGDAWCGVAIIDSNMGDVSNFVHKLAELGLQAEEELRRVAQPPPAVNEDGKTQPRAAVPQVNPEIGDSTIAVSYIFFEDFADVLKRGCGVGLPQGVEPLGGELAVEPIHPWLDADWIRGRYKQMTRGEFLRNHCNKPSGQGDELWSAEQIDPLFLPGLPEYALTPALLAAATRIVGGDGRWRIGVGLDRAGAFSKLPDRTVLTLIGQTIVPAMVGVPVAVYDELGRQIAAELCDGSVYVLLGAWEYMYHLRDPLQAKIEQIHRAVGIGQMCLEQYQASDLCEWCKTKPFGPQTDLRHMTPQAKQQLVQFMHGLVIMRRFFAPASYHVLRAELGNYREDASGGGIPSYGGGRKTMDLAVRDARDGHAVKTITTWIKDDYLESALWAVEAARGAKPRTIARLVPKPFGL